MIDADEVAKILGVSRGAVYDLAAPRGPLPCARFGPRCIRFNVEDVEAFKKQHMVHQARPKLDVKLPRPTVRLKIELPGERKNVFQRMGISTKPKLSSKRKKDQGPT